MVYIPGFKYRALPVLFLIFTVGSYINISAQEIVDADSIDEDPEVELQEVTITRRQGLMKLRGTASNTQIITASELKRAACCNLGESFTTNPSVDVSYTDAATGARQIKLLGLSGTYVQMLTENIPNFRGAASPYGLGYIPGTWMQSIQVSKGASSVKNGYESVTGQINVEMKKPQVDQEVSANGYVDQMGKAEVNANGNLHLSERLSAGLLLHGENSFTGHDGNSDGFLDMPRVRQLSAMNRWAWMGDNYVFQAAVKWLDEHRRSGQDEHHTQLSAGQQPYRITIDTKRWEAFTKNAYIFDKDNDGNVALILSGSWHQQDSKYGYKLYDVIQKNLYVSLMFERKWGRYHSLSTGLSFNYDNYRQRLRAEQSPSEVPAEAKEMEAVPGAYAQYSFNYDTRLLVMAGIRYDHSSRWGSMVTPRFHIKWNPREEFSIHASAGRGYRTPHVMAENNYVLASARRVVIASDLTQEDAWNFGAGANAFLPLFDRTLNIGAEYYYTHFRHQMVTDFDADPHTVVFADLKGRSYSHTVQVEATYPVISDLTATAAYRYTDVKVDYGRGLVEKPLTGRWKGLLTLSYTPMMGIWQADVTLALNGGGRMPAPYTMADGSLSWPTRYKTFPQLSAQLTRNFRHWAVYLGGENLTGYRQKNPIVAAGAPWSNDFDATMVYGPLHGAIIYAGFRYTFTKY